MGQDNKLRTVNDRPVISRLANRCLLFIVTCGFMGYLPGASGTYASIFGCIIIYLFPFSTMSGNLFFVCAFAVCSIICINFLKYDGEDPSYIVIDELAGMFIAMAGHKPTLLNIISGFILFRIFDIIKPYPIKRIERLKRGYGVVADDVLAGLFANCFIWLGYLALRIFTAV